MKFVRKYVIDHGARKKRRNVIILLDGTWNDETGKKGSNIVTNIVKMRRLLKGDSKSQIVRYFRGVGNDEDNNFFGRLKEGAFGAGEKRIRNHAYATICKEYRAGDRIFIFGFSRGAASARMLASDLSKIGIPDEIVLTTSAYSNKSSKNLEYRFESFNAVGKSHPIEVEYLGAWDTVYAFGIPVSILGWQFHKYDLFKNKTVASNIVKAVHLVAIDETRDPYCSVLMEAEDRVHEVWFPGVHSDVGGGYVNDELGRITLNYMLQKLDEHCTDPGRKLNKMQYVNQLRAKFTALGHQQLAFHFHGLGYKKSIRGIHVLNGIASENGLRPKIHASVEDLQDSPEVFSCQRKKRWFRGASESLTRIVYNPPNVKTLEDGFEKVS